jgi:WD40 repeat protein
VTALAFLTTDNAPDHEDKSRVLLLAGEDVWLKVFDVESSLLISQVKVFDAQPIHGIYIGKPTQSQQQPQETTQGGDVLLWGGHSVTLLPRPSFQALVRGEIPPGPVEYKAPDWIYDGVLFPTDLAGCSSGVLVTAHNEIFPFSTALPGHDVARLTFGPPTSPSRPILYSAHLSLDAETEEDTQTVLVAAGTVFGEIIVWRWRRRWKRGGSPKEDGYVYSYEVLHVLTGHEGSVFGVCIAPEPVEIEPGVVVRLLASCSDDRTVRVWDISAPGKAREAVGSARELPSVGVDLALDGPRETGFGRDNDQTGSEGNGEPGDHPDRLVGMAMGHVSRIWHVKFGRILRRSPARIELFSFGEDGSRRTWVLDFADRMREQPAGTDGRHPPVKLKNCGASTCHSGKNIWSAVVLDRGDEAEPLVATGGADGRIVLSGRIGPRGGASPAEGGVYEDLNLILTFDIVLQSLNVKSKPSNARAAFQRYAFLSDTLLAATASGRLFLATMGDPLVWEEVSLPDAVVADLQSYNVIRCPARDTALLGSTSGKIYLFRRGQGVCEVASFGSKVSDIILLDASNAVRNEGSWTALVNLLGLDHAVFLHFDSATGACATDPNQVKLPEHYIITAAAFIDSTLILGSRTGSMTVYSRDSATGDFVPAAFHKDCKTKDAITCIVPIPGCVSSFLATCRDGRYRIYTLSKSPHLRLYLQHEISPPLNTLETAFFTTAPNANSLNSDYHSRHYKSHLILHGFRGPSFVVYDDSTRSILSSTVCGGAHRPFATVSRPYDPGQTRFVFSKGGDLRVVSQSASSERVLRSGGHGREIRALATCQLKRLDAVEEGPGLIDEDDRNDDALVATAAEDTTIRLWSHHRLEAHATTSSHDQPLSLQPLAILEGHAAGIQTLRFFRHIQTTKLGPRPTQYLFSSAGSEEFFVWRISRVGSAVYDALAVVREAAWEREDVEWKEVQRSTQAHAQGPPPGKDLRIVDFEVAPWTAGSQEEGGERYDEIIVTMVLSDSTVRSYIYTPPSFDDGRESMQAPAADNNDSSSSPSFSHQSSQSNGHFRPLARGRYTGACPTQVRHLHVDSRRGSVHALVAYTDGHVAVWQIGLGEEEGTQQPARSAEKPTTTSSPATSTFRLALVARLHQSSIKCLDLQEHFSSEDPASTRWLIATGGDDNALCFLDLARQQGEGSEEDGRYVVLGRYRVRSAHAAAVTGLCLVPLNHRDVDSDEVGLELAHLATVSNDQRVKLWRVERRRGLQGQRDSMRVALLDNGYCSVADAGDMTVVRGPGAAITPTLMVGGVGVEMWDVTDTR